MITRIKELHEMSGLEFHQIASLRTQVFVVEQDCPYQEVDAIDLIAKHLCIFDDQQQIVSYARIFYEEEMVHFGRVLVNPLFRGQGYADKLLQEIIKYLDHFYPGTSIQIEAQAHLQKFYGKYGFDTVSDPFDEDGILHVVMRKEK
jgi:ElaA protein